MFQPQFELLFIGEPVSSEKVKESLKTLTPSVEVSIKQTILHTIGDSCDEKGEYNKQLNGLYIM